MKIDTCVLSNGIRVLHVQQRSDVAYCGAIVNAGTRDELPAEHGMAHLAEHMLFKGTPSRNSTDIINRLEGVGGDLNAFTTKEDTTIYAVSLKKHLGRAYELISDLVFHSLYADEELDKERMVVMDEIDSYLDDPSDLIMDDFEDLVFSGYALGRNILGTKKALRAYRSRHLKAFVDRCYTPDQVLFFSMGSASFDRVCDMAHRCLDAVPRSVRGYDRLVPEHYERADWNLSKHCSQMHCQLGGRAYHKSHPARTALHLVNFLLGGPNSSSRLNMVLRERNGLVYTVESSFVPYTDTGVWSIYFGADKHDLDRILDLIRAEIDRVRREPLSSTALRKLKDQFLSQLTIAAENSESWLLSAARQFMISGRIESQREIARRVQSLSAEQLCEAACDVMDPDRLSCLIYR